MDHRKHMDIIVIGGSITGLMVGILLKRQGHNVHILEAATSSEREGVAAGIGLAGEVQSFFEENDRLRDRLQLGAVNQTLDVVDDELNILRSMKIKQQMITWETAYYRLRANFDNFSSPFCPAPLPPQDLSEGDGVFETGVRVLSVEEHSNHLTVHAENVSTGKQRQIMADAVIVADGANSKVRQQVQGNPPVDEPGYVIWRGTVPTTDLPEDVAAKLENQTILYSNSGEYTYVILYTIPGTHGTCKPGQRAINVAWYTWPASTSPTTTARTILTDTNAHTHRKTLPKGLMRPETWQAQLQLARKSLPEPLTILLASIREPFVSLISASSAPLPGKAAYMHDRLFVIGDALVQLRPNTGAGANCCAIAATSLAKVFSGEVGVREWEGALLRVLERERSRAVGFSGEFLFGKAWARWVKWRYCWACYWAAWVAWFVGGTGSDERVLGIGALTAGRWRDWRLM